MNHLNDMHPNELSVDELRVMKLMYEHQREVDKSQNWRLNQRVYVMIEEALSPDRVVEKALKEKGLACCSPRDNGYAYAISYEGYEWYQREVVLKDQPS